MISKFRVYFGILAFSVFYSSSVSAVTLLIGDVDGFGFMSPNNYQNARGGLPDTNGNGVIQPGEYLPDLDADGKVHVGGYDEFDNRSAVEKSGASGAQWTDISLEKNYGELGRHPADDVEFVFSFSVPGIGDSGYGLDHFINLVFADYDVSPASLDIDGNTITLATQSRREDGLVQLAYASVPWANMQDGEVVIEMNAPKEPYVTIDYAYLHTSAQVAQRVSVSEPTSLALAGLGFMGMIFAKRRKEQKK